MDRGLAGRQVPWDREKMCDVSGWRVSNHAEPSEYDRGRLARPRFLAASPSRQREFFLMTQTSSAPPAKPASRMTDATPAGTERMTTDDGKITVAQGVVQKIAGIACREISGVHAMGVSTSRAFGAVRERIPGSSGPNVAQGVGVEVGETQAAIDLDIVVEYGVSIADLGRSIQRNVKQAVERMTGLDVVEINVNVDDLYLPDSGDQDDAPSRVS
jgi:uncharacterized alkaline shock family protein YloU